MENNLNSIFMCTPTTGEVDMAFHLSTVELATDCSNKGILFKHDMVMGSILPQNRNICVSNFLNDRRFDNLLFVDSDVRFDPQTAHALLNSPYDVAFAPYPVKQHFWRKSQTALTNGAECHQQTLGNRYTISRVKDSKIIDDSWIEANHGTTGFMMIRRHVLEKIAKAKPNLRIDKSILTNAGRQKYMNLYNFFDFKFNPKTGEYTGEDFNFCKMWRRLGGKIHAYTKDYLAHCGRFEYTGRYYDEFAYDFSEKDRTHLAD